ncbi:MAG: DinB family protein [Gemmataceae bacterium]|nr:DinB family protein [Gemmataceae bacterium]
MDRSLIEQYAAGATVPADLIRGLSAADLDARPEPGRWSLRQLVVHLLDSDLVGPTG